MGKKYDTYLDIDSRSKFPVMIGKDEYTCNRLICYEADGFAAQFGIGYRTLANSNILFLKKHGDRRIFLSDYEDWGNGFPFEKEVRKNVVKITSEWDPEGINAVEFFPPKKVLDDVEKQMKEVEED